MTIQVGDTIPAATIKTMGENGPIDISTGDIFSGSIGITLISLANN